GSLGDRLRDEAETPDLGIVKTLEEPLQPKGGLVSLFGSLAPGGAILKRSAADDRLFEHEGRAVVFTSLEDLAQRVDDPDLDVEKDDILVLQNAGPKSGTGMPEAGYLPIPSKLARAGVKDMLRISDARMSGTAFGTIILHVTPEAATGGPLGLVRNGDRIRLSVERRSIDLLVDEQELDARRRSHQPPAPPARGYARLYHDHVLPADAGCDFDFLKGRG
ncbi:MAG: dihydroxy-acid dehydratase, partial [Pseudomonadota bacterium]